jgi:S1-C subfamily serine protease
MNLKAPRLGLCESMILVCTIGFATSLVPALVYAAPFWGVHGFMDKEPFASSDSPGVFVIQIDSGSPAASTGLRERDRVLTVNGVQVEFGNFRDLLDGIQPENR